MTTLDTVDYALGRSAEEYERLRAQARVWQPTTDAVLDRIGVPAGATCLDAGCGAGETMRSMARRVGSDGVVVGLDVDAALAATTRVALQEAGHTGCRVVVHDLVGPDPVPGGRYDVVLVRLVLFHLPQRDVVLRRLWEAVAPGGVLVVQDYVLGAVTAVPADGAVRAAVALLTDAFEAAGCDVNVGLRLADLFRRNGIGDPDGSDIGCRVDPIAAGAGMLERTCRSVLPGAVARGLTTQARAEEVFRSLQRTVTEDPHRHLVWPLLAAAWKHAPGR